MNTLILAVAAVAQLVAGEAQLVSCDGSTVRHTVAVQTAYAALDACATDTECEDAASMLNSLNVCGW